MHSIPSSIQPLFQFLMMLLVLYALLFTLKNIRIVESLMGTLSSSALPPSSDYCLLNAVLLVFKGSLSKKTEGKPANQEI